MINGVCRAMWLSLQNFLQEKLASDSILTAWLIRHGAWCLTRFQVKNDGRTAFVRVSVENTQEPSVAIRRESDDKYTSVPTGNLDRRWSHGIWVGKAPMTDEHIILTENGVQKARSLHRVPLEERFVISKLKKQGGELESNDCDATGPRPIWTSTCVLDDQGRGKAWCNAWLQWLCRFGTAHRKDVECDWKRHWLTKELVQVQSERELDRSQNQPLNLNNQHWRHNKSQRLRHLVLLCRCRHKTFRTSSWSHRWNWEHKNAESARERGQTRRQQVKSLEDQW